MDLFILESAGGRLALAFGLAVATAALCWLAASRGLLPNGVTARSNHRQVTSRAGGTVVALLVVGSVLALSLVGLADARTGYLVVAVGLAGVVGFADDAMDLSPLVKLAGLGTVAVMAAAAGGPIAALPIPGLGWFWLPSALGYVVAALWVIGFVNVFNFLDGLNGMAAGTGIVLLAGIAFLGGASPLVLCAGGALLGFAVMNVLHGRPFLGDAGSLAVGTAIAGAALVPGEGTVWLVACGAIPFVADAGTTLLRRAKAGERLTEAHSDHAYQQLHRAGWSHEAVSLAYALMALAGMAAGALAGPRGGIGLWAVAVFTAALWFCVTGLMAGAKSASDDIDT